MLFRLRHFSMQFVYGNTYNFYIIKIPPFHILKLSYYIHADMLKANTYNGNAAFLLTYFTLVGVVSSDGRRYSCQKSASFSPLALRVPSPCGPIPCSLSAHSPTFALRSPNMITASLRGIRSSKLCS